MEEGNELADDTADDTVAQSFACSFDSLTSGEKEDPEKDVEGEEGICQLEINEGDFMLRCALVSQIYHRRGAFGLNTQ